MSLFLLSFCPPAHFPFPPCCSTCFSTVLFDMLVKHDDCLLNLKLRPSSPPCRHKQALRLRQYTRIRPLRLDFVRFVRTQHAEDPTEFTRTLACLLRPSPLLQTMLFSCSHFCAGEESQTWANQRECYWDVEKHPVGGKAWFYTSQQFPGSLDVAWLKQAKTEHWFTDVYHQGCR